MEAWTRCDWPAYHTTASAARRAQAVAFVRYRSSLRSKLKPGSNDRLWWNLTKILVDLAQTRFALDVDALANFFTAKLSLPTDFNSVLPTLPSETSTAIYLYI